MCAIQIIVRDCVLAQATLIRFSRVAEVRPGPQLYTPIDFGSVAECVTVTQQFWKAPSYFWSSGTNQGLGEISEL